MKSVALVLPLFLILGLGCREQSPPPPPETQPTATTSPTDAATAAVDTVVPLDETRVRFLERAVVGREVGADGMVQTEVTTFKRGDPIYASVRAKEVPSGLVARVTWLGPQGKKVGEEQKPVPPDTRVVTFQASRTTSWKPGEYTVELWLGGDQVSSTKLQLQK